MAAGASLTAGCTRLERGDTALRRIVLRMPQVSRSVFWERARGFADQNGLASDLMPQRPAKAKDFDFILRGKGLEIIGRNNAYDPLQPDDYVISFYGSRMFPAGRDIVNRFADTFLARMLGEHSIKLISDSGVVK